MHSKTEWHVMMGCESCISAEDGQIVYGLASRTFFPARARNTYRRGKRTCLQRWSEWRLHLPSFSHFARCGRSAAAHFYITSHGHIHRSTTSTITLCTVSSKQQQEQPEQESLQQVLMSRMQH